MEDALQEAVDAGQIHLPLIEVDFSEANEQLLKPIDGRVTSLTVPHRLADAILRDSLVVGDGEDAGKLFRDSSYAEYWRGASTDNATPIYDLCPTALMFGVWGAPEKPGGLGAKFQRCITSEIVAIDAAVPQENRQGLRRDPLGIVRGAEVEVLADERWQNANAKSKNTKRPSEINHGPILFGPTHGGVTFREAEQTTVLTLAGLRWLRFPRVGERWEPSDSQRHRDEAARTVLAALGLCAAILPQGDGLDLRSGCLLRPESSVQWELLTSPEEPDLNFEISPGAAVSLLNEAVAAAEEAGVTWRSDPVLLKPSEDLINLIRKSQELAAAQGEGE
jgi:CRISPR-associated protein Csb1